MASLLVVVGLTVMVGTLLDLNVQLAKTTQHEIVDSRTTALAASTVETILPAFRAAETQYYRSMIQAGCLRANSFIQALRDGIGSPSTTGCIAGTTATVFTLHDLDPFISSTPTGSGSSSGASANASVIPFDYTTTSGCTISDSASTCTSGLEVLDMGVPGGQSPSLSNTQIHIYFVAAVPEKRLIEMMMTIGPSSPTLASQSTGSSPTPQPVQSKRAFAILDSFSNAAHIEADSRVTQENPNSLGKCPGTKWANLSLFDPVNIKCVPFVQLGSGTGLAYFGGGPGFNTSALFGGYFGFRPSDGTVIDLVSSTLNAGSGGSYIVKEDGTLTSSGTGTVKIFPRYNQESLVNVDDITLIGTSIYTIWHQGLQAQIEVLVDGGGADPHDPSNWKLVPVCNLGVLGWGQSYEGIAALSWSDDLSPGTGNLSGKLATFYLKTSGGDRLIAKAMGDPGGRGIDPVQDCFVTKDLLANQMIEYKRTYGFERAADEKPYLLY